MKRLYLVVPACLFMAVTAWGAGIHPVPQDPADINARITQLEAQLAKEPIQRAAQLPKGSAQCVVYSRENIKKVEELVKLHQEAKSSYVLEWREHLAWMYENCLKGPGQPIMPEIGDFPKSVPSTLGLEHAFDMYTEALITERARSVAVQIAQKYEELYLKEGDEALLVQARMWRLQAREKIDEIKSMHDRLQTQWYRKRPPTPVRSKIT